MLYQDIFVSKIVRLPTKYTILPPRYYARGCVWVGERFVIPDEGVPCSGILGPSHGKLLGRMMPGHDLALGTPQHLSVTQSSRSVWPIWCVHHYAQIQVKCRQIRPPTYVELSILSKSHYGGSGRQAGDFVSLENGLRVGP